MSYKSKLASLFLLIQLGHTLTGAFTTPVTVATWDFINATAAAWNTLNAGGTAVEAVVAGCGRCEQQECGTSVGYGGNPDESSETTLDAMIMDGVTMDVGAVGCLRNVMNAIGVAHAVMTYTTHTLLVGDLATSFAQSMGFPRNQLSTPDSIQKWDDWKASNCQPNFRRNVSPDPEQSCGPYAPSGKGLNTDSKSSKTVKSVEQSPQKKKKERHYDDDMALNHDTIGMLAIDEFGNIAGGTSTNGLTWKIPGRVGDSPIVGAGAYADNEVGAATATGNGDIMMRFSPSFYAVELMRGGADPTTAATTAIARIAKSYPSFSGAVLALTITGEYGAACHNRAGGFPFAVMSSEFDESQVVTVECSMS